MTNYKILLLDVDGVLALPPRLFSEIYCERYDIDNKNQEKFYSTDEFKQSLLGKLDLKDAIKARNDLWHWEGDFQKLVEMWLEAENYPNKDLVDLVDNYRLHGLLVYLATQQEKHRASYIQQVMFRNHIDGMFCSCDIHKNKHDIKFWQEVLRLLIQKYPGTEAKEIAYFDDRRSIVDVAKECGIDAHLYTKISDVENVIGI